MKKFFSNKTIEMMICAISSLVVPFSRCCEDSYEESSLNGTHLELKRILLEELKGITTSSQF